MNAPQFDFAHKPEPARLFPVLSTTSKEGRATSILLSCLSKIDELGAALLGSLGQRVGIRSNLETFTEVVFTKQPNGKIDRPDGLIILTTGKRHWTALVEAKVGNAKLDVTQIEKYREIAKLNGLDCVITISNEFAMSATNHPIDEVRNSRSKIPVFHWSWMYVLTEAELLLKQNVLEDKDQSNLLNELRRFLSHESTGVRGFDRMPTAWQDLNKFVAAGGTVATRSPEAADVVDAWHQETRDLSLILSRLTETSVGIKLTRAAVNDIKKRRKDDIELLKSDACLKIELDIEDAAAPLEVCAKIVARTFEIGMKLRAPQDRVSASARVNWLLRQIKSADDEDLFVRLDWPGRNEATIHSLSDLRANPKIADEDNPHLAPHSLFVFMAKRTGARFTQRANFISDLETFVPTFYGSVGSALSAWQKKPPAIRAEKQSAQDVSPSSISEDAEGYE